MTKDELEQLKKEIPKGSSAYYLLRILAPVIEQAWVEAERVCAILEQIREGICSCDIVDVPEWFHVCEWHKEFTNDSEYAEQLVRMLNRIGVEIDELREKNNEVIKELKDAKD